MVSGTAADLVVRHGAPTVATVRRALAGRFRAGGIDSPELDARILVGHALGLGHAAQVVAASRVLDAAEEAAVEKLAKRRLAREPVARIVGLKEFWSLELCVSGATLVPRPETETVVEAALGALAAPRSEPLRIVDVGTGSGAIMLALLTELPHALGVGTDFSTAAVATARNNARRLGLARASFVVCNMTSALRGPFDLVVSNPPYIASAEIAGLAPEVRDHDPRAALDGGTDGLDFYRSLAASVPQLLARDGVLVVELGAGQSETVAAMFTSAGLVSLPPRADLNGVPRALVVRTKS